MTMIFEIDKILIISLKYICDICQVYVESGQVPNFSNIPDVEYKQLVFRLLLNGQPRSFPVEWSAMVFRLVHMAIQLYICSDHQHQVDIIIASSKLSHISEHDYKLIYLFSVCHNVVMINDGFNR